VLASGIVVAAATLTTSSGTAAIVTLAFTVGTWALDFVAAGRGGLLQTFAAYTPGAALRTFEQGTLHLDVVLVFIILGWAGFALAAVLLATGRPIASRLRSTAAWVVTVGVLLLAGSNVRASWDLSENRRNSFPQSAEQALKRIHTPLQVTVFLAAEDPRLMDLDRNILAKLRRIVPKVDVTYAAQSRTGLFEGAADHYGEVWYAFADRKIMSRSTTEPIVLEAILQLAGISQPPAGDDPPHLGYPLNARPTGAAWIFYLIWPLGVAALGWLHFRG
jgi:ABC-2 type transport system permease protein